MTLPVSLSVTLYKSLAEHILTELWFRLRRDNIESKFDKSRLDILRHNNPCLLKAAGKLDTAMDMMQLIEQLFDVFAVGTDLPKKHQVNLPHVILDCFVRNVVNSIQ